LAYIAKGPKRPHTPISGSPTDSASRYTRECHLRVGGTRVANQASHRLFETSTVAPRSCAAISAGSTAVTLQPVTLLLAVSFSEAPGTYRYTSVLSTSRLRRTSNGCEEKKKIVEQTRPVRNTGCLREPHRAGNGSCRDISSAWRKDRSGIGRLAPKQKPAETSLWQAPGSLRKPVDVRSGAAGAQSQCQSASVLPKRVCSIVMSLATGPVRTISGPGAVAVKVAKRVERDTAPGRSAECSRAGEHDVIRFRSCRLKTRMQ